MHAARAAAVSRPAASGPATYVDGEADGLVRRHVPAVRRAAHPAMISSKVTAQFAPSGSDKRCGHGLTVNRAGIERVHERRMKKGKELAPAEAPDAGDLLRRLAYVVAAHGVHVQGGEDTLIQPGVEILVRVEQPGCAGGTAVKNAAAFASSGERRHDVAENDAAGTQGTNECFCRPIIVSIRAIMQNINHTS